MCIYVAVAIHAYVHLGRLCSYKCSCQTSYLFGRFFNLQQNLDLQLVTHNIAKYHTAHLITPIAITI